MKSGLQRTRRSGQAFTLTEVLIGMMLIGLVAASLFAAISFGFGVVTVTRHDLRATQIMTRKIEGLRLCRWSQLPSTISFSERYDPLDGAGVLYSGRVTTNSAAGLVGLTSYRDDMRLVTVSISWTDTSGFGRPITRTRQVQTLVARYGLQNYLYAE